MLATRTAPAASTAIQVTAAKVRQLRRRRRLTQHQLAARAGIGRSSIAHLETARLNPTLGFLTKLAKGLGVQTPTLLKCAAPAWSP